MWVVSSLSCSSSLQPEVSQTEIRKHECRERIGRDAGAISVGISVALSETPVGVTEPPLNSLVPP